MVDCIDYYNSGVYQNKSNSQIIEIEKELATQNNQVSFGMTKPKEKVDEFVSKDKEFLSTCTDGQDDGKVGFREGAKAFLGGVANHYLGFIEGVKDFVKENPVKSAAMAVCAVALGTFAIATFGAPVLLGMLSLAGITLGVKGIISSVKGAINNIKNAKNAQTDAEKKQALYGLGGNSAEFVDSSLALYGGVKGLKAVTTVISQSDDYARLMADNTDDIAKNIDDLLKKAETGSLSKDEMKIFRNFCKRKEIIWENLKNPKKKTVSSAILSPFLRPKQI